MMSKEINHKNALYFRDELRNARAIALEDAEGYQSILFTLERLGAFLYDGNGHGSLGKYRNCIVKLAEITPLAKQTTIFQSQFSDLYTLVNNARNDALHQGAFARHLTENATVIALILEDALALKGNFMYVRDFMIKSPVCAALWQPISFIRQQMLSHSFSYLPFFDKDCSEGNRWKIISDYQIAQFLHNGDKAKKLKMSLEDALKKGTIKAELAIVAYDDERIEDALQKSEGKLMVVTPRKQEDNLLGVITPFDML